MLPRVKLENAWDVTADFLHFRRECLNGTILAVYEGNVVIVVEEGDDLLDDQVEASRLLGRSELRGRQRDDAPTVCGESR